jgi:ATP-dependent RNA helicase RhlE
MYQKNNNRSSHFGKSSFGGQKNHFRGGSGGSGKPKSRFAVGSTIHHSRFICKAEPIAESVAYVPVNKFADFKINEVLKSNIINKGYKTPTPIQDGAIPYILTGRDVIGIANTGTGKTAAFLIPLLDKIINNPKEKVLIMVPTRELAQQINQEFMGFKGNLKIFSVVCVGGVNPYSQIYSLRRSHNIVIGTPGRLKDLVNRKIISLSEF